MAVKMKIRKGDRVVVLTGKDKGNPKEERVLVQGVNMVKRHTRADRVSTGGIIDKEAPLHVSNVAHVDPKTGKPTRVGYKFTEPKGKGEKPAKIRFARRSGEVIDS
jgi:large subunit ribosomal protein L24